MAKISDTVQSFVGNDHQKEREQYSFLKKVADDKIALYKSELENMFLNPEAVGKVQIIGKRAFEYTQESHVGLGSKSDVTAKIGDSIGNFLKGDAEDITKGILDIASVAVDSILGNVSLGEQEFQTFFVMPQHNAIIRTDIKCWRYNFSSTGIITNSENIFCYVCCKSVVDHTTLTDDEFTFMISEYVGDDPDKVKAYAEKLRDIWKALKGEDPKNVLTRVESTNNSLKQGGEPKTIELLT
ncbi:hypothetical protein [Methanosarcina mazei]|uniref:Uncharacterized protein n=1 Tax=Methanosarcina mazei SarPi TaxID=1434115 RepID=A0A0E3R6I9_METMZ|nr:hypothetical protein [Methanosarcina mazei]AKB60489.1 hypothetical protein MSMAP_0504 [Methanosarcina mazei SarPi]